jgi:transcriptional regulator with XRE-family HTH domain
MPASETGIKLRFAEFDRQTSLRGWTTDAERARQLGVSHAHLTNMRAGRTGPGAKFIGKCLSVFGANFYDVLFERTEDAA